MLYNAVKQKYLGDQKRRQWAHQTLVHYYQVCDVFQKCENNEVIRGNV
jgi:hypothetical protein